MALSDPERMQRRYYARKEAGLCVRCGKAPAEAKRVLCAACEEKGKRDGAALRDRRRRAGQCIACGEPLNGGEKYATCFRCRKIANERYLAWIQEHTQKSKKETRS